MQLGEYCSTTKCIDCPIYKFWKITGIFKNNCMENLRFPEIAAAMDEEIKRSEDSE